VEEVLHGRWRASVSAHVAGDCDQQIRLLCPHASAEYLHPHHLESLVGLIEPLPPLSNGERSGMINSPPRVWEYNVRESGTSECLVPKSKLGQQAKDG